jgi:hypothetical protein
MRERDYVDDQELSSHWRSLTSMTTFFVAPHRPEERESAMSEAAKTPSNLRIDPDNYKVLLLERWPGIDIYRPPEYVLLEWIFPSTNEWAGPIGGLEPDQQTVVLDAPLEEFFLWQRTVIPANYRLFLFHEGSWDNLVLKLDTSLEELRRFING